MTPSDAESIERDARRQRFWKRFLGGLGLGTLLSVLIWIPGFLVFGPDALSLMVVVPVCKLLVALGLMFSKAWRGAGAGLLVSIPIGAVIFFGSCLAGFAASR